MSLLETTLNPLSKDFETNRSKMLEEIALLEERLTQTRAGGEKGVKKFRERGKLLPRERLELLPDPRTPVLEL